MADDSSWPLTSKNAEPRTPKPRHWFPGDPLDIPDLPPIVYPLPLIDKALVDNDADDKEMM